MNLPSDFTELCTLRKYHVFRAFPAHFILFYHAERLFAIFLEQRKYWMSGGPEVRENRRFFEIFGSEECRFLRQFAVIRTVIRRTGIRYN